jgi:hypothetical protein
MSPSVAALKIAAEITGDYALEERSSEAASAALELLDTLTSMGEGCCANLLRSELESIRDR